MSFRPSAPKPKLALAQPAEEPPRKKATVRFTERQWKQLRAYMYEKDVTLQALIISSLADKLEKFDP